MAELNRCQGHQMVWFLVPTKVLCSQQLEYLSQYMPAVSMRMLTGDDGVDCWRNQSIWDNALQGMKVIFSTHAVLADALTHGFMLLNRLALIVFDEGNRIMRDFYHVARLENSALPSILGLTASVDAAKIPELERNLDATCRAPLVERHELTEYVPHRSLTKIYYTQNCYGTVNSPSYLDMLEETVIELREHSKREGYSIPGELFKVPSKARAIQHHLGAWALRYFLTRILQQFAQHITKIETTASNQSYNHRFTALRSVLDSTVEGAVVHLQSPSSISDKVKRLLYFLKERSHPDFSGVVFVRERVTAYVLSALLDTHPLTKKIFRCAPCVSSVRSESWAKDDNLFTERNEDVILQFRSGLKNLIVATSVLEEGIDLPACHVVISFDFPDNITSFIQRRGRARQGVSEFAVMEAKDAEFISASSKQYSNLERQMQVICLDHQRSRQELETDDIQSDKRFLQLRLHTGALLTSDNAISHLYHFCTTLRSENLGETHPTFSYKKNCEGLTRSTVYLPSGIDPSLRIVDGHYWWGAKQSARKDAAFQAVRALHGQKLINDHLLPLFLDNPWTSEIHEGNIVAELPQAESLINFWKCIPGLWTERKLYKCRINFCANGIDRPELAMAIFTPIELTMNDDLHLHWDNKTTFTVSLQPFNVETAISTSSRRLMRKITTVLFQSTRSSSVQEQYPDFLPFFTPDLPLHELEDWLSVNQGSVSIREGQTKIPILAPSGFIRSPGLHFAPHIFVRWIQGPNPKDLLIECRRFGKRKNLLERVSLSHQNSHESDSSRTTRVAATNCILDFLPWELSLASLAIPPILQLLHQHLMANEIQVKIFKDLPTIDSSYVREAITAPSSQWPSNYQRMEFFGDSILKFVVAVHAFLKYPLWHEGYLSKFKDQIVSNERLTCAAASAHLERFICADFISQKHPIFSPVVDELQNRTLPRKVLADVVEALTAAAYESGGISLARHLLGIFLPELSNTSSSEPQRTRKQDLTFPVHLEGKIDLLLGFKFRDRALIWEALTHPSWQRDSTTGSYQRLEFLGDAILDFCVSKNLYSRCPKLAEGRMTELRAALVNADFLAFLCMELTLTEPCCFKPISTPEGCEPNNLSKTISLWMFMRHDAQDLIKIQASCSERYQLLGDRIKEKLKHDLSYPWATLAQLAPPKFYSDLIESTIGAIFIDSGGRIDACEQFLEKVNLIAYLERFVGQAVLLGHPKNALDRILGTRRSDFHFAQTDDGLYNITVWLEDENIASINNCFTKSEALVRGADAALAFLSHT
ncbi:ATP-dependent helicase dcl2 [Penicillium nucicola]|uniref:ATP-dependent helicase dcl2 n=1 Tax=Penicillium nucicola TaxID=1850975 RepID=UPI0025455D09|nr:ATP-dependent helicase dcl2 [Penicillium nucicola]KAJ5751466.1 ATP-dependent helicase dcl2 [Penicillium nucicola]